MADLPLPTPAAPLPALSLVPKPKWRGLLTTVVGRIVQIGAWLRVRAAVRFLASYHTVFAWDPTRLYFPTSGPPGDSVMLHERVHAYHVARLGRWRYAWLWLRCRGDCEASAYAAQVVAGYRTIRSAASSLADPIYATGLSEGEALALILEHIDAWREAGWDLALLREMGRG